jgi:hypothetical protein
LQGELFSTDFVVSMLLFFTTMIIITTYYQNLQNDLYESNIRNDMYSRAISVSTLLAESSGYPQSWNSTNVRSIGLYDSGKFNLTKFEELKKMNYQSVKSMLGTGSYEFMIDLRNVSGSIIVKPSNTSFNYSFGINPSNNDQTIIIKRIGVVTLEGTPAKVTMEVILWS